MAVRSLGCSVLSAVAALIVSASAEAYTATVAPAVGPPTTAVTLNGTGFAANNLVDVFWDTTQIGFGSTTAAGALNPFAVNVPAMAQPGVHYITVRNDAGGGGAQASFLVRTNWAAYRWGPALRNANLTENTLTPSTIGNVERHWTATIASGHFIYAAPLIINGVLYDRDYQGDLAAWSLATHKRLWKISTGLAEFSGITYGAGNIYFTGPGVVRAYNATTGALVWVGPAGPDSTSSIVTTSTPTVSGNVVYVFSEGTSSPGLYAFSTTCGSGGATCVPLWVGTGGASNEESGGPAPTVVGGVVAVDSAFGPIAFDTNCVPSAGNCSPRWTESSYGGGNELAYGGGYIWLTQDATDIGALPMFCPSASCSTAKQLAIPNNGAYAVSIAGASIYAVSSGTLLVYPTACAPSPCAATQSYATPPLGGGSPTIAGGLVFQSGATEIWAYDRSCISCGPVWSAPAAGSLYESPVVADGVVYVIDQQTGIEAYDLAASAALNAAKRPVAPALSSLHRDPGFAAAEALARQRLHLHLPIDDLQPKPSAAADDAD